MGNSMPEVLWPSVVSNWPMAWESLIPHTEVNCWCLSSTFPVHPTGPDQTLPRENTHFAVPNWCSKNALTLENSPLRQACGRTTSKSTRRNVGKEDLDQPIKKFIFLVSFSTNRRPVETGLCLHPCQTKGDLHDPLTNLF